MLEHPKLQAWQQALLADFIGNKIEKLNFVQVNPKYFEFDENSLWVLDGGVEVQLSNGKTYTYAWNKNAELMDMWAGKANEKMSGLDFYSLEKINEKANTLLADKTIAKLTFEWNWYQMMDENFELEDELHFAPLGLIITFDDGQFVQLAAIQFGLDNQSLAHPSYLPEGDMLVSINRLLDIYLEGGDEEE